jgi:ArsR family transcriptional regulator, arsenate/arsenite/antimonite-responsive transcriptional repressor
LHECANEHIFYLVTKKDSDIFRALGHPHRLRLIGRLLECGRPCTVTEMQECCPIDFSVVSRHLFVLRDAGIVKAEKRGKKVYYSVAAGGVASKLRELAEAIEGCCGQESVGRKRK